jgi:fatty acid desaturase
MAEHRAGESRWASELRALLAAVAVLGILCLALIAEALWGNGAMLAILLAGAAVFVVARYAVPHHRPRAH